MCRSAYADKKEIVFMINTLYPIELKMHIILVLLAVLVFGLQFIRLRKKYYLVLAVAMPLSLLPYLVDSDAFFYGIGIVEALALIGALVLAKAVDRDPKEPEQPAEALEAAE
jgi:hypothetical protein